MLSHVNRVNVERGTEFVAPLGNTEEPSVPFEVTHMNVTGPYPVTQRGNKFLLTFMDGFSKYVEAFPMMDQTAELCAVYMHPRLSQDTAPDPP